MCEALLTEMCEALLMVCERGLEMWVSNNLDWLQSVTSTPELSLKYAVRTPAIRWHSRSRTQSRTKYRFNPTNN